MAVACRRALMRPGFSFRTVAGLASGLSASSSVRRGSPPCSFSALCGTDFYYHGRSGHVRHVSQIPGSSGKRAFIVDTMALVRKLEAQDIPSKHAEAITSAITTVVNDSLENVNQSFLSQGKVQKEELQHDIENLRRDLQHNAEKMQFEIEKLKDHMQHHTEKHSSDMDKLSSEMKSMMQHQTEKLSSDMQFEIEKLKDHMQHHTEKHSSDMDKLKSMMQHQTEKLSSDMDKLSSEWKSMMYKEILAVRVPIDAVKYDIIKYFIATIVSLAAVGLAVVRLLVMPQTLFTTDKARHKEPI